MGTWEGKTSIFLCHSSKDKWFVRTLKDDLVSNAVTVWLDESEINVGDSLFEKIETGLKSSQFLGIILSQSSVGSQWVKKELEIALSKELREKRVVVLPLLIEDCEIPGFLESKKYADFRDPNQYSTAFCETLRSLGVCDPIYADNQSYVAFISILPGQYWDSVGRVLEDPRLKGCVVETRQTDHSWPLNSFCVERLVEAAQRRKVVVLIDNHRQLVDYIEEDELISLLENCIVVGSQKGDLPLNPIHIYNRLESWFRWNKTFEECRRELLMHWGSRDRIVSISDYREALLYPKAEPINEIIIPRYSKKE